MRKEPKIVIIGGGPTGIGAAYHLRNLGYKNWILYEKNDYIGGLSTTYVDDAGFLWDNGGHVLHSHYEYYDQFVKEVLGKNIFKHRRESWIRMTNSWVPYPFQNNIKYLPMEDQLRIIRSLIKAQKNGSNPKNFKQWILKIFGEEMAKLFMFPYNFSVWATPPEKMSKDWIAERVSMVDLNKILENIIKDKDDTGWGPNNTFIFPKYGGTGEIYKKGSDLFKDHVKTNKELSQIDLEAKKIKFKDGKKDSFDYIISAVPLPELTKLIKKAPAGIKNASNKLIHNGVFIVGIGLKKKIKTSKCWVYFTDPKVPFYRLTFFHNYSPHNVPDGNTNRYSSLMCEISYSKYKKVDPSSVIRDTINGLIASGIIDKEDRKKIVSKTKYNVKYGYPIPTLDRDKNLEKIQPYLMKNNIYSRGRFGTWKYEVANMDHCFMQGVEAVDNILDNKKETVLST